MSTKIDLSRTSGLVTLGTHTFLVTDRTEEVMPDSGTPGWRIIARVVSKGEDEGKEVMHQISLGAASRFKMDEFLDGIGAPKKGAWDLGQCIGKKFRASVEHDVYQGKEKTKFTTIFQASDSQASFDEPSEIAVEDGELPDDVLPDDDEEGEEGEKKSRRRF
jgi:hypothetical protein